MVLAYWAANDIIFALAAHGSHFDELREEFCMGKTSLIPRPVIQHVYCFQYKDTKSDSQLGLVGSGTETGNWGWLGLGPETGRLCMLAVGTCTAHQS